MIRRKEQTDEEFVAWLRKRERLVRRMRWVWPVMVIGYVAAGVWGTAKLTSILFVMWHFSLRHSSLQQVTGVVGLAFGFLIVVEPYLCVQLAWPDVIDLSHYRERCERLLLRYHDAWLTVQTPAGVASPESGLSDAEYVAWIRLRPRLPKPVRWPWMILLCVSLVVVWLLGYALVHAGDSLGGQTTDTEVGSLLVLFCFAAITAAWTITPLIWLEIGVREFRRIPHGFRTELLLLKYHDALATGSQAE